jgi:hypothetical protein
MDFALACQVLEGEKSSRIGDSKDAPGYLSRRTTTSRKQIGTVKGKIDPKAIR